MNKEHYVSEVTGCLHNRKTNAVIRTNYSRHYRTIKNGWQLRATLRAGKYAWPGGYEVFGVTQDGFVMCFDCIRKNLRDVLWDFRNDCSTGWKVTAIETAAGIVQQLACDHCNLIIVEEEEIFQEEALANHKTPGIKIITETKA